MEVPDSPSLGHNPHMFLWNIENPQNTSLYFLLTEMYFGSDFKRYVSTNYRWSINSCLTLNGSVLHWFVSSCPKLVERSCSHDVLGQEVKRSSPVP